MSQLNDQLNALRQDLAEGLIDKETYNLAVKRLMTEDSRPSPTVGNGSAVAQGEGATALAERAVSVKGNVTGPIVTGDSNQISAGTTVELTQLLAQLQTAVAATPSPEKETALYLEEKAKTLVTEAAKENPNPTMIKIEAEGLKKAAQNILTIAPIVSQIVAALLRPWTGN